MGRTEKYNLVHVISWTFVAIFMVVIFMKGDTIKDFGDNRIKTILLASLFIIGFGTDAGIRIVKRSKKLSCSGQYKEIQNQSTAYAFIIVLIYIYLLNISLYLYYEEVGFLPVGWIWFSAYSTIVMANLASGYSFLFLNIKEKVRAKDNLKSRS